MYQIVIGDRLDGLTGFAPSREAADNHKGVESLLAKQMRHTGAGGFALSSTVQVDVLVLGKCLDFLRQVIRLDADGAPDAGGT
jgi:hypothetical protein